jgi:hypothetical protein
MKLLKLLHPRVRDPSPHFALPSVAELVLEQQVEPARELALLQVALVGSVEIELPAPSKRSKDQQ